MQNLLTPEHVLITQPMLIKTVGRTAAQFLHQLHYWLNNSNTYGKRVGGIKWVYNTLADWAEQLCISERQIQRIIAKLKGQGLIHIDHLSKHKSDRTNYYTINYVALDALLEGKANDDIVSPPPRRDGHLVIQKKQQKIINKSAMIQSEDFKVCTQGIKANLEGEHSPGRRVGTPQSHPQELIQSENSPKPKTTTAQDMLRVWNEVLGQKAPGTMDKTLAPLLVAAFGKRFDGSLDQWRDYCQRIGHSDYIMGAGFTLTLEWALRFGTIDRLQRGELGVPKVSNPPETRVDETTLSAEAKAHMEHVRSREGEGAYGIRRKLLKAFGPAKYMSWLTRVTFREDGGELYLDAENPFVDAYVRREYGDVLLQVG